ncbi:MAG: hypothetical protein WB579_07890, partial [Bryobacteraceae bacterium]
AAARSAGASASDFAAGRVHATVSGSSASGGGSSTACCDRRDHAADALAGARTAAAHCTAACCARSWASCRKACSSTGGRKTNSAAVASVSTIGARRIHPIVSGSGHANGCASGTSSAAGRFRFSRRLHTDVSIRHAIVAGARRLARPAAGSGAAR